MTPSSSSEPADRPFDWPLVPDNGNPVDTSNDIYDLIQLCEELESTNQSISPAPSASRP